MYNITVGPQGRRRVVCPLFYPELHSLHLKQSRLYSALKKFYLGTNLKSFLALCWSKLWLGARAHHVSLLQAARTLCHTPPTPPLRPPYSDTCRWPFLISKETLSFLRPHKPIIKLKSIYKIKMIKGRPWKGNYVLSGFYVFSSITFSFNSAGIEWLKRELN